MKTKLLLHECYCHAATSEDSLSNVELSMQSCAHPPEERKRRAWRKLPGWTLRPFLKSPLAWVTNPLFTVAVQMLCTCLIAINVRVRLQRGPLIEYARSSPSGLQTYFLLSLHDDYSAPGNCCTPVSVLNGHYTVSSECH